MAMRRRPKWGCWRAVAVMADTVSRAWRLVHTVAPDSSVPRTDRSGRANWTSRGSRGCDDRSVARSVLLVDDDPEFRRLAKCILGGDGPVVVGEAETVATAIAAAHELRPEAALVDVGLPDGSGVDLARVLTALPWRPRIGLTSTDPDAPTPADVARSGARTVVPKTDLADAPLQQLLGEP